MGSTLLGEWKFTRFFLSTCFVSGIDVEYLDSKTKNWLPLKSGHEVEKRIKGIYWVSNSNHRTLIYNLTVPIVKKNVDLCLFNCPPKEIILGGNKDSAHYKSETYLALGELKGGIDPAGADEHWKTANSALERIRKAFTDNNCQPKTFFIGAAIVLVQRELEFSSV